MPLPEMVQGDEPLARYTVSRSKVNWETGRPRMELFMPHPYIELSMFRIQEMNFVDCVTLGQAEFAEKLPEPRPLLGWAELLADQITGLGLALDPSSTPDFPQHERHANVLGWPEVPGDPKMQKARQKEIALELSEAATAMRFVEPLPD